VNSLKIILASLVIFGAGAIAGVLVGSHHPFRHRHELVVNPPDVREHGDRHDVPPPPLVGNRLNKDFLQRLDDKLQLTPDQKDKIGKIIADGQERNHQIWTNVAPQLRAEIQDVHKQIREQLTPEQREQFDDLLKRPRKNNSSTNAPPVPPSAPATNSPASIKPKTPCV
jgi:hypothetical protein